MKKRILFVEDDPLMLQLFVMMMEGERDRWEVITKQDGRQALQILEGSNFDVVVSDMNMPGMSGVDFIREVRTRHPRSSRIILSALTDQERVARCLDATHQFLAKPFDIIAFKAALDRISSLDAYLQNEKLQTLVGQLGTLPSFPSLYIQVLNELGSFDASIDHIADVIAKDPGMTAKMLQIVNSAAMGLARKIGSPFEAVEFLGFGTVRSLVLSAHIFSCFERTNLKGFSIQRLWDHSMKCAFFARMILQLERGSVADPNDAYTSGMLHDVGKLMLANSMPEQFQQALNLAAQRKIPLHEAEQEIFGATHAGVAAYLLGLWGLPASIVEAVAFHHHPLSTDLRTISPLTATHVANALEHELSKTPADGPSSRLDMAYLAAVGARDRLDGWRAEAMKLGGMMME
jgi:HD-like signal output (HDOD) protein